MPPKKKKDLKITLSREEYIKKFDILEQESSFTSLNKHFSESEISEMVGLAYQKKEEFETKEFGKTFKYTFKIGTEVFSLLASSKVLWLMTDFLEKGSLVIVSKNDKNHWMISPEE